MTGPATAAGVVLAAGLSSRFGGPATKLLLPYGKTTVLGAVLASAEKAGLDPVFVVIGHRGDEVRAGAGTARARFVSCADSRLGRGASLRAGLEAVAACGAGVAVVLLGDEPGIRPEAIRATLGAFLDARAAEPPPAVARARYEDRPGHPVVLAREAVDRLLAGPGRVDKGAWAGLAEDPRRLEVEIEGPAPVDVDTPDDLRRALARRDR
ncbi:MAG: NTP transferase domain-containing protein [Gemmatimonadota bacterium]